MAATVAEHPTASPAGFRPDIQGLRAVAVLLVVIGHTGLALPGGFVGVDVFFVVSGFVIGQLLLEEVGRTGTISLRTFYERRARRLLPALALVLVATVAVGVLVLNPSRSQEVPFETAAFGSVFAANLHLYRHVGYFDGAADGLNPLLHLWSLSVEEQFYLALPFVLLVAARRRLVLPVVAVGSVASFALAVGLTGGTLSLGLEAPARFAFYAAPTRAWELGAGVLLAAAPRLVARTPTRVAAAAALLGAVAIGASSLLLDPLDPFPGANAVPVVVGTVALLVGGARSAAVRRALSIAPLRWLGDRSYAWYLWHWPAIVYARVLWRGSDLAPAAAAAISLGLAAVSYRLLEDRLRRDPTVVGRRALRVAAVAVVVPLVTATAALRGTTWGWGVEEPSDWYETSQSRNVGCVIVNRDLANAWDASNCTTLPPSAGADPSAVAGTILVLGDVHADSVSTAVIEVAADRDLAVAVWSRAGCPLLASAPAGYPACGEWQDAALALVDDLEPAIVVVANRSTSYTTDPDASVGSNAARITAVDGGRTSTDEDATLAWGESLDALLGSLGARDVPVVLVGGAPGYRDGFPWPSVLRPSASPPVRARAAIDELHDPVVAIERQVAASHGQVRYLDPVPILCEPTRCTPFRDGRWLHLDAFALNLHGSRLLVPALAEAIGELQPPG